MVGWKVEGIQTDRQANIEVSRGKLTYVCTFELKKKMYYTLQIECNIPARKYSFNYAKSCSKKIENKQIIN